MTPAWRSTALLYVCLALALAFVDHRARSDRYRGHVMTEYVPSVVADTSGAPAKYRVLAPFALDLLVRTTGSDPYLLFLWFELVFILATLLATHAYLGHWYPPGAQLGGTLALAAFVPLTFTNTWAHPDTFLDLFLFTAACAAVAARRDLLVALLVGIGMFNRETIGFVAVMWALARAPEWRDRRTWASGALLFGVCFGVYVGLRWYRGFEGYELWMLPRNIGYLSVLPPGFDPFTRIAGFFWIPLVLIPGWWALQTCRDPGCPPLFRAATVTAALFVLIAWLFAAIIETRVFVPALALLLPPALGRFVPWRLPGSAALTAQDAPPAPAARRR